MILQIGRIIIVPTRTSALVVAAAGMMRKSGARNSDSRKSIATVNEVSPVRPPSEMPVALSTYVVTIDVPHIAPTDVPMASDIKALFSPGMLPSFSTIPALSDAPISVPMVSKMSMKSIVNTTI